MLELKKATYNTATTTTTSIYISATTDNNKEIFLENKWLYILRILKNALTYLEGVTSPDVWAIGNLKKNDAIKSQEVMKILQE